MSRMPITQELVKKVFHYDPDTGILTRYSTGKQVGSLTRTGYLMACITTGICREIQRIAWLYVYGQLPLGMIDHINGIKTDNRISNLRDVSRNENLWNMHGLRSNNTSGYPGVSLHKQVLKWRASIKVYGKDKHLGLFTSPEEAYSAYLKAKEKYHTIRGFNYE